MTNLIVEISEWPINADGYQFYAEIPSMPGLGESGKTRKEAFNELMISLKVLIAYNSKLDDVL